MIDQIPLSTIHRLNFIRTAQSAVIHRGCGADSVRVIIEHATTAFATDSVFVGRRPTHEKGDTRLGNKASDGTKRGFDSTNGNEHSGPETDQDYIKGNGVSRAE